VSSLVKVVSDILSSIAQSVIDVSKDHLTALIDEAYKTYYRVNRFSNPKYSIIAFTDAGVYPLDFDVASLLYIQIGSLIRVGSSLKSIHYIPQFRDGNYPPIERILLSVTRRRRIEGDREVYVFDVEVRTPERKSILFGDYEGAISASRRITRTLDYIGLRVEYKSSSMYWKLTKYIEGLIELAYSIRILQYSNDVSRVVVDGTLVRWLRPGRGRVSFEGRGDGVDILAAILDESVGVVKKYLLNSITGLSKTTSFTTISRSMSIFRNHIEPGKKLYEYYTTVNTQNLNNLSRLLLMAEINGFEGSPRISHEVVVSIIKKFNTCVYPSHGIWVARFPITMDGSHIMVLDVYTDKPIVSYDIKANTGIAQEVNKRVTESVSEIFYAKSPIPGRPPTGLMELDEQVRVTSEVRRDIESYMVAAVLRGRVADDSVKWSIVQNILGSSRMRFGYTG